MEKPTQVEVGQRWLTSIEGVVSEVTADGRAIMKWSDGDETDPYGASLISVAKFLGWAPGYGLGKPVPAMEATTDGLENPVGCLSCGVPRSAHGGYPWIWCKPCGDTRGLDAMQALAREWRAGKRDFPRPPTPVPVTSAEATAGLAKELRKLQKQIAVAQAEAAKPRIAVPVEQSWVPTDSAREAVTARDDAWPTGYSRVGNVTALQVIQSRKPPEPWIPSVDEFDLLPDA